MHNSVIAHKANTSGYKYKNYSLPSGKIIKIQGYENHALNDLLNKDKILENDIVNGCDNVPEIWYNDIDGKQHRHYVDIYISSQNKCIEIKSPWTLEKGGDNIFLKQKAGKALGYEYEIWVYNSKGIRIECHK